MLSKTASRVPGIAPLLAAAIALLLAVAFFNPGTPRAEAFATTTMSAPEYQFLAELNADRQANGLAPLAANGVLSTLARQRSQQILDSGQFSHYDAAGNLIFVGLLGAVGFDFRYAGENLAWNNYALAASLDVANSGLMGSPAHRANILNGRYNQAGIGIAGPGPLGQFYYTQLFAEI